MPEQDDWKEERGNMLAMHRQGASVENLIDAAYLAGLSSQARALKEQTVNERDMQIENWLQYELKEYKDGCGTCGGVLVEIRGRYPNMPRRKVCSTCLMEIIESARDNLYPNNQAYNSEPNLSAIESIEI